SRRFSRILWLLSAICVVLSFVAPRLSYAADDAPAAEKPQPQGPIGQFLTLPGTLDDVAFGKVSRAALALQSRAQQEGRRGVLVIEVPPGSSPFHQIRGMAKFLSTDLPGLKTVAWVPKSVTGFHTVLALACQEIVLAPDANLGDISLGKSLDPDEQAFVLNLANRRHNRAINEALVLGMIDRQRELLWVQIDKGANGRGERESKIVSRTELDELQRSGVLIPEVRTIKEVGAVGVFSGERCRNFKFLATNSATSRAEVTDLYSLPREAMRETETTGESPRAIVIRIDGPIDEQLQLFVQRQISRAIAADRNMIVFEIDSPKGGMQPCLELAATISELKRSKVQAVGWIPRGATGGAALLAMGCDAIHMRGDSQLGGAQPALIDDEGRLLGNSDTLVPTVVNELVRLAESKGRPKSLAAAMADKDLQVFRVTNKQNGKVWYLSDAELFAANGEWDRGAPVAECEGERVLTVTGARANELLLAEAPTQDFDELKARLGIPANEQVEISGRTWVDSLVFTLNRPAMTGFLLFLSFVAIYFESHYPIGVFGIFATICIGLFFWSRFLGGTAGWLEVVLFVLGIGCLMMELFVVPGFGVFGVAGIGLCLASLVLAMQTTVIPYTTGAMRGFAGSVGTIAGAFAGVVALAAVVGRYLPSIPFLNRM
ncbi:MAG: hypothetical protein NT069_16135, partial [Planctomycetota bacterium]|nr:hypothetical protein [Planctomycetota bacterium]